MSFPTYCALFYPPSVKTHLLLTTIRPSSVTLRVTSRQNNEDVYTASCYGLEKPAAHKPDPHGVEAMDVSQSLILHTLIDAGVAALVPTRPPNVVECAER